MQCKSCVVVFLPLIFIFICWSRIVAECTRLVSERQECPREFESHLQLGYKDKPSRGVAVFTNYPKVNQIKGVI